MAHSALRAGLAMRQFGLHPAAGAVGGGVGGAVVATVGQKLWYRSNGGRSGRGGQLLLVVVAEI